MNSESVYKDDYRTCSSTDASLYAYHVSTPPAQVTEILGIEPTTYVLKGEGRWSSEKGWRPEKRPSSWQVWGLDSRASVKSRDSLRPTDWLLEQLEGKDNALTSLWLSGWTFKIWVFWHSEGGHGGPRLTPSTMRRLAELNLSIEFDVYGVEEIGSESSKEQSTKEA